MKHFITVFLFCLCCFFSQSCRVVRYKDCVEKFGTGTADTVWHVMTDTVEVPADSATFTIATDTVPIYQVVQQGRARVTLKRTKKTTTVKADCLPEKIYYQVRRPVAIQPKFKPQTNFWRTSFLIQAALSLIGYAYFRMIREPKLLRLAVNGERIS